MSKDYAKERAKLIRADRNDPNIGPGDPYPFQRETNPFLEQLRNWSKTATKPRTAAALTHFDESFRLGTTSVEAADEEGWVVSITPSGGWMPAVIAGKTGIGLSQRAQSFDTDPNQNPYNVIEPGKRPHVTLTPTLALEDGRLRLTPAPEALPLMGEEVEKRLGQAAKMLGVEPQVAPS